MRGAAILLGVLTCISAGSPAWAELQNVEVGGSIEIYGNWYTPFYESGDADRIPSSWLSGRPIGLFGTYSPIRTYSHKGAEGLSYVEQRSTLHVNADFSQDVSAFIELDSIDNWGEDFRSANYLTGADQRANSSDDLEIYQAYIQARNVFQLPLQLKIGRQELIFGSGWLVGNNYWFNPLTYLSFDAFRLTYEGDKFTVDAFAAKLNESMKGFGKGDTDLYGIYATCTAVENISFDAYWLFLHDGATVQDTSNSVLFGWMEDLLGRGNYGHTQFHTVGLRTAGEWNHVEFEAEAAYQYGDASGVGVGFAPYGYGDDSAWYNTWAGHFDVGYTFQVKFEPHIHVGADYYGGEDRRHIDFLDYINPFYKPRASVSFNRLFSDYENDWFLDGGSLSNYWIAKTGVSAKPMESLETTFDVSYMQVVAPFDTPVMARIGSYRVPIGWPFAFVTKNGRRDLGFVTTLSGKYQYSEDLSFETGWSHLFTGGGLEDGAFVDKNGLGFYGGLSGDDADYFWAGTKLTF